MPPVLPFEHVDLTLQLLSSLVYISNEEGITMNDKSCTFFNKHAFSVFRDPLYVDFFDYLDKSGGFYFERWGDSAVNSPAACTTSTTSSTTIIRK